MYTNYDNSDIDALDVSAEIDRNRAIEWWCSLSLETFDLHQRYYPYDRPTTKITGYQIQQIWEKEKPNFTNPKMSEYRIDMSEFSDAQLLVMSKVFTNGNVVRNIIGNKIIRRLSIQHFEGESISQMKDVGLIILGEITNRMVVYSPHLPNNKN